MKTNNQPTKETSDKYINEILSKQSLFELRDSVSDFLEYINCNPKYKDVMCKKLIQLLIKFGKKYFNQSRSVDLRTVLIPQHDGPLMMMFTCFSDFSDTQYICEGLKRFISRCNEFIVPVEPIITIDEINLVLSSAQNKFRMLDIIAIFKPLFVIRLNNSHFRCNCECGISDKPHSGESVIFVYHPSNTTTYDRVFIFAHEIGHALHLALTHDVSKLPKGFAEFNERLGITGLSLSEQQETFADAVAFSILNCDELKCHIPKAFLPQLLPYFDSFVERITTSHFNALNGLPF